MSKTGIVLVSLYTVKWLVKSFAPSASYSKAIRASRDFTNKKQNDFPQFFSLNNLLFKVCPLLQIENVEFRLYWKRQNRKNSAHKNTPSDSCATIIDEKCYVVLYIMQPSICAIIWMQTTTWPIREHPCDVERNDVDASKRKRSLHVQTESSFFE